MLLFCGFGVALAKRIGKFASPKGRQTMFNNHSKISWRVFIPTWVFLRMLPVFSRFLVCSRLHHFQFRCLARLSQNICKNHPNPFKKEHVTCPFSNKNHLQYKNKQKTPPGFRRPAKVGSIFRLPRNKRAKCWQNSHPPSVFPRLYGNL